MTFEEIHTKLREKFGSSGVGETAERGQVGEPWCTVASPDEVHGVALYLRDEPSLAFDYLVCLSGVDYSDRTEVVYHLLSYTFRHDFTIKVKLTRDNPVVPSLSDIWPAANWHEREAYDLVGVLFAGHPDLRRILLPTDWVGHPLRVDWQEGADYHGIGTTRVSSLDLWAAHDKEVK